MPLQRNGDETSSASFQPRIVHVALILVEVAPRILLLVTLLGVHQARIAKYGPAVVAARSPKLFVAAPPSLLASESVSVARGTSGPPPSSPPSRSRAFDLLVSSRYREWMKRVEERWRERESERERERERGGAADQSGEGR